MKADVKSVLQLSRADLAQIAAAVNSNGGIGIQIKKRADGYEISVDQQGLASMIYSFCKQQGTPMPNNIDPREMNLDQV